MTGILPRVDTVATSLNSSINAELASQAGGTGECPTTPGMAGGTGECPEQDKLQKIYQRQAELRQAAQQSAHLGLILVCLETTDGVFKCVWLPRAMTVEEVLTHYTPAALKTSYPVIVVDGAEAWPDLSLSGLHTKPGILHMTFQEPVQW